MKDLGEATAVTALADGGRYSAMLFPDYEIWGPEGGYVAAVLFRAAAAESSQRRPASLQVHFLGVARSEPVELTVTVLRTTRRAESLRVSMTQDGRPVAEALAWFTAGGDGLAHHSAPLPDGLPPAQTLPTWPERMAAAGQDLPSFPFWDNVEHWPLGWHDQWPPTGPEDPVWRIWARFQPTATFTDPVVDACRSVALADIQWPAAGGPHAWRYPDGQLPWVAPTLDLSVQFHALEATADVLLLEARCPVAGDGLIGGSARVWSAGGTLLASAAGQLLCRPVG